MFQKLKYIILVVFLFIFTHYSADPTLDVSEGFSLENSPVKEADPVSLQKKRRDTDTTQAIEHLKVELSSLTKQITDLKKEIDEIHKTRDDTKKEKEYFHDYLASERTNFTIMITFYVAFSGLLALLGINKYIKVSIRDIKDNTEKEIKRFYETSVKMIQITHEVRIDTLLNRLKGQIATEEFIEAIDLSLKLYTSLIDYKIYYAESSKNNFKEITDLEAMIINILDGIMKNSIEIDTTNFSENIVLLKNIEGHLSNILSVPKEDTKINEILDRYIALNKQESNKLV